MSFHHPKAIQIGIETNRATKLTPRRLNLKCRMSASRTSEFSRPSSDFARASFRRPPNPKGVSKDNEMSDQEEARQSDRHHPNQWQSSGRLEAPQTEVGDWHDPKLL